ncbi:type I restriction endonuclease [Actinopolyspora halophila]|uniref:type I restriction endonuclease n=1 Tax=Actinopolyspora halophila TaxID=1850 RepID=UPI000360399F|nr:type I restriction endonuclease [Actinopolyspora halophila]
MGIAERTQELALKVRNQKVDIETEEATKNAFVMPFISNVLGYDVFNPAEVIPEYTADVGAKKGEKIDYALVQDGKVQVLIETKKVADPLRVEHASQLFRYFATVQARIAILTNGEVYEFYTDLEAPNRMDSQPFLVLDLAAIDDSLLPEVAKLARESFDLNSVISTAEELKYVGQIKRILAAEFKEPSDKLVRFLASQVYSGKSVTQRVREQFAPLVAKATSQFLTERVNDRLKTALGDSDISNAAETASATTSASEDGERTAGTGADASAARSNKDGIETTEEEVEGLRIVRAIVCSEVTIDRVSGRDSKTYFAVLLDDNNRKTIARLWFNRSQKYLGVFDENKVETRMPIASLEDIYRHADQLRTTAIRHAAKSS